MKKRPRKRIRRRKGVKNDSHINIRIERFELRLDADGRGHTLRVEYARVEE